MDIPGLNIKSPCPNCGSKDFGTLKEPHCILPMLVKDSTGYLVVPNEGAGITPVICNECGYILLFHAPHTNR